MPLRELYPLATASENEQLQADIVAVHGINYRDVNDKQHAWDTWRKPAADGVKTWLEVHLPQHTPQARIFLYEYKSNFAFGSNKQSFLDVANELLEALRLRSGPKEDRPLIFIAHSLGGLLVEQALVNAKNNDYYSSILNSTTGLAFFGTPQQRASRIEPNLGKAAARVVERLFGQTSRNLIGTLQSGVLFTELIGELWRHQLENYHIVSFWEGQGDTVPKENATLGLPGVHENVVMLNTEHSDLCRFDDSQDDEDNLKLVLRNIQDLYTKAPSKISSKDLRNERDMACILDWISKSHVEAAHQTARKRHVDGTGEWFLKTSDFTNWRDGRKAISQKQNKQDLPIFWCTGMPGAGKTIMTSVVIEHLKNRGDPCAYVYCERQARGQQTMTEILASLLKQLLHQRPIPPEIIDLYRKHSHGHTPITEKDCEDGLVDVLKSARHSFLIIDALDETMNQNDQGEYNPKLRLLEMLVSIISKPQLACSLFVTSREDCRAKYKDELSTIDYHLRAKDEDIELYAENWWGESNSSWKSNADMKAQALQKLKQNADGQFLLPVLHMRALSGKTNLRQFKQELNALPTQIFVRYDEAMNRIEELDDEHKDLAKKVLSWVSSAAPPLSVGALQHALALDPDNDEHFEPDGIDDDKYFLEFTAGLVTFEAGEVHLIHSTVREFFLQKSQNRFPDAFPTILNTCISYLQLKDFADVCEDLPKRYKDYPFLQYAAFNWASYAAKCWRGIDPELRNKCLAFVTRTPKGCLQILSTKVLAMPHHERVALLKYSSLHVAVLYGAEILLPDILKSARPELEAREHKDETPLHLAARSSSVQLVKALLNEGADINAINHSGKTALDMVMLGPYEKVSEKIRMQDLEDSINMFLNTIKIRQKVEEDRAERQEKRPTEFEFEVEIAVLEAKVDLKNIINQCKDAPNGREVNRIKTQLLAQSDLAMELSEEAAEIAEVLIKAKIDLYTRAATGHSALQLAALYGRESMVRLLLDNGFNPFIEGGLGHTALELSRLRRHDKIEELLLRRMEDLRIQEEDLDPQLKTTIPGPCQAGVLEKNAKELRHAATQKMFRTPVQGETKDISILFGGFRVSSSQPKPSPSSTSPASRVSSHQQEDPDSSIPGSGKQ